MKIPKRKISKNWKKILELRSTIIEKKILLEWFKGRFDQAEEKKSVNLKIGHWKLSGLRTERYKIEEKSTETKEPMGHYKWINVNVHIVVAPEEDKGKGRENIWRNKGRKVLKFDEKHEINF